MKELFTIPSAPVAGAYTTALFTSSLYLLRIQDAEDEITAVEAIADGKINTYLQNSNTVGIPSPDQDMSYATGDLWIDTYGSHASYHKNNVFRFRYVSGTESITGYFYNGSAWDTTYRESYSVTAKYIWEDIADLGIADAISIAEGKITTFYATSPPTPEGTGDLWVDTSTSKQNMFRYIASYTGNEKGYKYSGGSWGTYLDDVDSSGSNCWIDIDDIKIFQTSTYVTVSLDPDEGDYQSLSAAISAIPSNVGTTIYVKDGEYEESDVIILQNKDVNIIGESKVGTVITVTDTIAYSPPGIGSTFSSLFYKRHYTGDPTDLANFCISNLTIDFDGTSSTLMTASNIDDCEVIIRDCIFKDSYLGSSTFLFCDSMSLFSMIGCTVSGCRMVSHTIFISVNSGNNVLINKNKFYGTSYSTQNSFFSVFSDSWSGSSGGMIEVSDNIIDDCYNSGLSVSGARIGVKICRNRISLVANASYSSSLRYGVGGSFNPEISGNEIVCSGDSDTLLYGIITDYGSGNVINNSMDLQVNDGVECVGIWAVDEGIIQGNKIVITRDDSGSVSDIIGIMTTNDENTIVNNKIELDSLSNAIGVRHVQAYTSNFSNYNFVASNFFKNCSTDIDDMAGNTGNTAGTNMTM